ncbi:hypothetical protein V8C37DRAFT_378169 [Trichoderma ceciliae]
MEDYVREIGGIARRLIWEPSYSPRTRAALYAAFVIHRHTGSPVKASLSALYYYYYYSSSTPW